MATPERPSSSPSGGAGFARDRAPVLPSPLYLPENGRLLLAFRAPDLHHAAARRISQVGGSLRDVQELARHASLAMTQRYIEGDTEAKRKLIALL